MNKTITSILLAAMLIGTGFVSTGCKTVPTETQERRIAAAVQVAAQIGGSIILTEHPEYKKGFEEAIVELDIIAASTNNVGISEVLAIIYRLDVEELRSPEAILYISSGILIINEFGVPAELNVNQSDSVRSVARALSKGLKVAVSTVKSEPITPLPPLPPGA